MEANTNYEDQANPVDRQLNPTGENPSTQGDLWSMASAKASSDAGT